MYIFSSKFSFLALRCDFWWSLLLTPIFTISLENAHFAIFVLKLDLIKNAWNDAGPQIGCA